ncbi:MAG: NHL repeat-containing protein [Marinosulfonomonas sp.]|nr:NHL repeat-containing protein [Marinosulfonomonas sp.]
MRLLFITLLVHLGAPICAQDANTTPFAAFDLASAPVLNDPHDLEIGLDGRLYIADKFGARIVVMDPDTLEVVDVLGEGALPGVHDISINALGTTVIAVSGVSVVAVYTDVANAGTQPDLALSAPRAEGALAHSNGRIYAMASGAGMLAAFEGGTLIATAGGHGGAHDVAEDLDGNVWVADNAARRLVQYTPDLERLKVLDHAKFGFVGPRYLDFDDYGRLVVADQDAHRILLIDPDGHDGGTLLGVLGDGQPGLGANKFDDPEGVVVSGSRYYISDSDNNRIVRYSVVLN